MSDQQVSTNSDTSPMAASPPHPTSAEIVEHSTSIPCAQIPPSIGHLGKHIRCPTALSVSNSPNVDERADSITQPIAPIRLKPTQELSSFLHELSAQGIINGNIPAGHELLDQEIHPIFDQPNWDEDFSQHCLKLMRPALQLASHFLSPKYALFEFFVKLTHAEPYRDLLTNQYLLPLMTITPRMCIEADIALRQMASVVRFYAEGPETMSQDTAAVTSLHSSNEGSNNAYVDFRKGVRITVPGYEAVRTKLGHDPFSADKWIAVNIIKEYLTVMEQAMGDEARLRRIHFVLAVTLVHELCHALWKFIHGPKYTMMAMRGLEPCVDSSVCTVKTSLGAYELGQQWEMGRFNMQPWAFIHITEITLHEYGEEEEDDVRLLMPGAAVFVNTGFRGTHLLLCMSYIDSWFLQRTWDAIRETGNTNPFNPIYCASCLITRSNEEPRTWLLKGPSILSSSGAHYTGITYRPKTDESASSRRVHEHSGGGLGHV